MVDRDLRHKCVYSVLPLLLLLLITKNSIPARFENIYEIFLGVESVHSTAYNNKRFGSTLQSLSRSKTNKTHHNG